MGFQVNIFKFLNDLAISLLVCVGKMGISLTDNELEIGPSFRSYLRN